MTQITAIMACDPDGVVGLNNSLPWFCKEELEHFRKVTRHSCLIMGYETYLSMPKSAFEDKKALVLSRNRKVTFSNPNILILRNIESVLSFAKEHKRLRYFLIGGAGLVHEFIDRGLVQEFLLSKLKQRYQGDKFLSLSKLDRYRVKNIEPFNDFTIYTYTIRESIK